ncbi:MAG: spore coat protein [Clostridia bacterium]|nr:spore coat protein [Clostridia bacterium]
MQQQHSAILNEQEMMNDALTTEKEVLKAYGTYITESTCDNLRSQLTKIINDKQQIQFQLYDTMRQKGWYQDKKAQLNEVQNAAQKFQSMKQNMQ